MNSEIYVRVFIFAKLQISEVRSFTKIKLSGKDEIILSFTDVGKACSCHDFLP